VEFIRAKDELVVVKLDRLARSSRDTQNLVHALEQKGAGLRVLEPEFCTATDGISAKILLMVLGMVAEMERQHILDRQRAGIEAAKVRGVYKGRPPKIDNGRIRELKAQGWGRRRSPRRWACPA
jgi:DNA invertase Pin-like site-specific DNA recombinase